MAEVIGIELGPAGSGDAGRISGKFEDIGYVLVLEEVALVLEADDMLNF